LLSRKPTRSTIFLSTSIYEPAASRGAENDLKGKSP